MHKTRLDAFVTKQHTAHTGFQGIFHANIAPQETAPQIKVYPLVAQSLVRYSSPQVVQPIIINPPPKAYITSTLIQATVKAPLTPVLGKLSPLQRVLTLHEANPNHLMRKARETLKRGQLNASNDQGALYYIRRLYELRPNDPQVHYLAKQVVQRYHQQALRSLSKQHYRQTAQLLWLAHRTLGEFNLTLLAPKQQALEKKLALAALSKHPSNLPFSPAPPVLAHVPVPY